jgi:hypothetical protein
MDELQMKKSTWTELCEIFQLDPYNPCFAQLLDTVLDMAMESEPFQGFGNPFQTHIHPTHINTTDEQWVHCLQYSGWFTSKRNCTGPINHPSQTTRP